jgi:hypothetical protein
MGDKSENEIHFTRTLDVLKAAGWITGYSMITDPWVVDWTPLGRERARLFLSLADELDLNDVNWPCLEAICKFLRPPPEKSPKTSLN